ncbi:MAG TPA: hypothetical protein V6D47_03230 [Oscillatoriaceae cyanobacterium]
MLSLLGLLLVLGCNTDVGTPSAKIDLSRVTVSAPSNGQITVTGAAGAVTGGGATTLTLTVIDHNASPIPSPPTGYRLQHLTGLLPVDSSYASLNADGSFAAVTMGSADRPIKSDDEINFTPEAGIAQAGYTAYETVP